MKKTKLCKILSFILCFVLIAAMALFTVGCNGNEEKGSGNIQFTLTVTHSDGTEKTFNVKTDKETVGEALTDEDIISGSQGQYGLMVETVDGETVKFADDGKYWAFYVGDEYAMTGVDSTEAMDGEDYAFKVE